jgi:hypothetical protein
MRFGFPTPVFQPPDSPVTPSGGADSGASTSSAPTTTSTTPATVPTSPSQPDSLPSGADSSSSPFDFMFGPEGGDPSEGLDGLSPPEGVKPEPKPTQPAQVEPAKPAVVAPEPAKPDATATPAPTEPTSPTPGQTPQPNLDPYDPGTLAAHLAQNEEQVVQALADSQFKLSDKDVEALEADTVGTIPRLLARTAVVMQKNFLMQMANIVPRMVQAHGEVTKRHGEAVGEFYGRWPDIEKAKGQQIEVGGHKLSVDQLVTRYATVYRQMNPTASRQEAIEAVGPMVMMAAKINPSASTTAPTTRPATPMAPNGSRSPQPAPFVPAGPASGGAIQTTPSQLSPVEVMFATPDE